MSKMTTKQLKAKLRTAGSRTELQRRFHEFRQKTLAEAGMSSSDEDEETEGGKATDYPAIVMLDEETSNKYMRLVPC